MARQKSNPNQYTPDIVKVKMASNFNSAASATWQDTGLKITLPTPGTWFICADLRTGNSSTASRYGTLRLTNETTATAYADTYRLTNYTSAAADLQCTLPITDFITTTTANNIIRVEILPAGAYTIVLISDVSGNSTLKAMRIG